MRFLSDLIPFRKLYDVVNTVPAFPVSDVYNFWSGRLQKTWGPGEGTFSCMSFEIVLLLVYCM